MPLFGPPDVRQLEAKQDIEGLIAALTWRSWVAGRENPKVVACRCGAAKALGGLAAVSAVPALMSFLRESPNHESVYESVVEALVRMGPAAVEPITAKLTDDHGAIAAAAADALGKIGDIRASDALIACLGRDQPGIERLVRAAARALAALKEPRAVDPLLRALEGRSVLPKEDAAEALGHLGDPRAIDALIIALEDKNAKLRNAAVLALAHLGDPRALEPAVALMSSCDKHLSRAAIEAVHKLGPSGAAERLVAALHHTDPTVRRAAALALADVSDTQVAGPLIAALSDVDPSVREVAAVALSTRGDPRAIDPLVAFVANRDDEVVRTVVRGVRKLITREATSNGDLGLIRKALKLPAEPSEQGAAEHASAIRRALYRLGKGHGIDKLLDALGSGEWRAERGLLIDVVAELNDPKAVKPLLSVVKSGEDAIAARAKAALVGMGQGAVEPLIQILQDSDAGPNARAAVAEMLGQIGDERATESLLRALTNAYPRIVLSAATALGRLRVQQAGGPLIKAMQRIHTSRGQYDYAGVCTVAAALAEIGEKNAVAPIEKILRELALTIDRSQLAGTLERLRAA